MRYVSCNFCGADDTEPVNRGGDLYLDRPGDYQLVRCQQCGLIYQNPQLTADELVDHYPSSNYFLYRTDVQREKTAVQRLDAQHAMNRRRDKIMNYVDGPGRVLDVGCATGAFLVAMRQQGWETAGVELNDDAATFAREELGLDVHTGMLETAAFPDRSFDVVTMWDVFEHVIDPQATLTEAERILRPGGWLVLSLPNPESLEARLFDGSWAGWDRPRHLNLFTQPVIRNYLTRTGFGNIQVESFSGRLSVTLLSVEYWCRARGYDEEKWRPWLRRAYNWPLRLATWPIYKVGEKFNKTTGMTIFAQVNDEEKEE